VIGLVLALGLTLAPPAAEAQQAGKVARVGILSSSVAPSPEEAAKYTLSLH
jgi:hypothetical protein